MKKTFHKTKISFVVLSEEPIPSGASLSAIIEEADIGEYVMSEHTTKQTTLTPKKMVNELIKAGAEPEFFGIDSDGNAV